MLSTLVLALAVASSAMSASVSVDLKVKVYFPAKYTPIEFCDKWKGACSAAVQKAEGKTAKFMQDCETDYKHNDYDLAFCQTSKADYTKAAAKRVGASLTPLASTSTTTSVASTKSAKSTSSTKSTKSTSSTSAAASSAAPTPKSVTFAVPSKLSKTFCKKFEDSCYYNCEEDYSEDFTMTITYKCSAPASGKSKATCFCKSKDFPAEDITVKVGLQTGAKVSK